MHRMATNSKFIKSIVNNRNCTKDKSLKSIDNYHLVSSNVKVFLFCLFPINKCNFISIYPQG